jgi:hypothetical protein
MRRLSVALLSVLVIALAAPARAQTEDSVPDPLALEIHAFVSQGVFITTENNYLTKSKNGSFEMTEVGINFTKPITSDLRVGLQIFAHDLGEIGNYSAQLDWFYLDYRWRDWLGFRAGRVKIPFGLYNEIHDADAARVPVLMPHSVYPVSNRDYFLAQTGVEVYGYVDLDAVGALDYRLYAGTIFVEVPNTAGAPFEYTGIGAPYVVGGRLLWESPLEGLRLGGTLQALRLDVDLQFDPAVYGPLRDAGALPPDFTGATSAEIPAVLWVLSIEYVLRDLWLAVEYTQTYAELDSPTPRLFQVNEATGDGLYGMAAYRVASWFQPGIYYAVRFTDTKDRDRRSKHLHDTALTLRFDINDYWLVKLEGHYLHGTSGLSAALNDGVPPTQLEPDWFLFIAKTTAYF